MLTCAGTHLCVETCQKKRELGSCERRARLRHVCVRVNMGSEAGLTRSHEARGTNHCDGVTSTGVVLRLEVLVDTLVALRWQWEVMYDLVLT